jgi:hypothetical protein
MAETGESQIGDLYHPFSRDEQIRRFQVAVQYSSFMCEMQSQGCLPDDLAGIGGRQRPNPVENVRRIAAIDELHRQVVGAVGDPGI